MPGQGKGKLFLFAPLAISILHCFLVFYPFEVDCVVAQARQCLVKNVEGEVVRNVEGITNEKVNKTIHVSNHSKHV